MYPDDIGHCSPDTIFVTGARHNKYTTIPDLNLINSANGRITHLMFEEIVGKVIFPTDTQLLRFLVENKVTNIMTVVLQ